MGSTSDLPVMEKACQFLEEQQIPFEVNALSAHRTPAEVSEFARNAHSRGIKVIIAGAGMAAALPGVIAAETPLPVIGVPIKGAQNAAVLAMQIMAVSDSDMQQRVIAYKQSLKKKIVKANEDLAKLEYKFKV